MQQPVIVKQKGSKLLVSGSLLKQLIKEPKPILWGREGLHGWIPVEIVRNAVTHLQDLLKLPAEHARRIVFVWGEAIVLPQSTGRSLVHYHSDYQSGDSGQSNAKSS